MVISKDKVVSILYELREGNDKGKVLETVGREKPMTFLVGAGNLLPKFEENLNGFKTGEQFGFLLKCEDAYGKKDKEAIVDLPKTLFMKDGEITDDLLKIGNQIPMRDKSGSHFMGLVIAVSEESVKMDFNHPLAGNDLFFTGTVMEIREPTEDEMKHGHAHGPDICRGCTDESCSHS